MNFSQPNLRRLSIVLTAGALVALGLVFYGPVFGQFSRVMITESIDETKLVTIPRSARPEATQRYDRGPVPDSFPMDHMLLQLKRSPVLESELVQYISQLTDKTSPNFHHWVTPKQLGEKYGPAQQDLDTIKSWLQSHGFSVYIYENGMVMDISGTAGMIRDTFHTEIHYLDVNGQLHFANMGNQRIPAALAPAIVGVVSMHDFRPHSYAVPKTDYTYTSGTTTDYLLVPADFQTIYNVDPLIRQGISGQGQTIVVVEDTDTYGTDAATYRSTFLSKYSGTLTTVHPNAGGNCTDPGTNADDGEADIDAEVGGALAPNATIEVASCPTGTTFGGLIAIENLVSAGNPPAIISMSYGECEVLSGPTANAAFNSAFQTAAAAGVSVFASSGDYGASDCARDFPNGIWQYYALPGIGVTGWGETIYNVSVGGTDFEDTYNALEGGLPQSHYWNSTNNPTTYGSAKSYIPEIPWNDSCASYLQYYVHGFATPYGASGFCNSTLANPYYLSTSAGGGGPSGCAYGAGNLSYLYTEDSTCAGYAKPSWQYGIFGNPADGVRDIPDVSLFASNGIWGHYVPVCWSDPSYTSSGSKTCTAGNPGAWSGFGGTSIAAPLMASVQALVNQRNGTSWQGLSPRTGLPTPIYYQIASAEFGASGNSACYSINQPSRRGLENSCAFNDITQGDIDLDCRHNGTNAVGCYVPSGTYGSLSTQALTTGTVITGGSGYTGAPTCTPWVVFRPTQRPISPRTEISSTKEHLRPVPPSGAKSVP
jgi:hypothetical protein